MPGAHSLHRPVLDHLLSNETTIRATHSLCLSFRTMQRRIWQVGRGVSNKAIKVSTVPKSARSIFWTSATFDGADPPPPPPPPPAPGRQLLFWVT